jgi:hypothetical protein
MMLTKYALPHLERTKGSMTFVCSVACKYCALLLQNNGLDHARLFYGSKQMGLPHLFTFKFLKFWKS